MRLRPFDGRDGREPFHPRRSCIDALETGQPPLKRISGGENRRWRPWPHTGREYGTNQHQFVDCNGWKGHGGMPRRGDHMGQRQIDRRDEAAGLASMAFRATLPVRIIASGKAEIGKGAVRKNVCGRVRCDRHGDGRLLGQRRYGENERAKHARRQLRQPVSQKSSCQKPLPKSIHRAKGDRPERQAGKTPHALSKEFMRDISGIGFRPAACLA